MAIQFPCGKCGALIEVDDQCTGGQCKCAACHATTDIPRVSSPTGASPTSPSMSPPAETGTMLSPNEPGRKGWAVASLTLAILGFCAPPLGFLAIVCGIVAKIKIRNNPHIYGGRGLATSGLVFGCIASVLIFVWALVLVLVLPTRLEPFLAQSREQSRRTNCTANLRAISAACLLYAEDNRGFFPGEPSSVGSGSSQEGQTCLVGLNGLKSEEQLWQIIGGNTRFMGSGSNPRLFFTLLKGGQRAYLQPKQFICPAATTALGHSTTGARLTVQVNGASTPVHDFSGSNLERSLKANCSEMTDFSYSFQVMTDGRDPDDMSEIRGHPLHTSHDDPRKALAADRNPYSNVVQNTYDLVANQYGSGVYVYSPTASPYSPSPPYISDRPNDLAGADANSRNHNHQGQNVAYLDGHIKWNTTPLAGADQDCIWMTLNNTATGPRIPLPGVNYGLMRSKKTWVTDSLLIP